MKGRLSGLTWWALNAITSVSLNERQRKRAQTEVKDTIMEAELGEMQP